MTKKSKKTKETQRNNAKMVKSHLQSLYPETIAPTRLLSILSSTALQSFIQFHCLKVTFLGFYPHFFKLFLRHRCGHTGTYPSPAKIWYSCCPDNRVFPKAKLALKETFFLKHYAENRKIGYHQNLKILCNVKV